MAETGSSSPLVSVIVPTHDRAALIGRALDSIRAQTLADREVIVVDDGSTDDTPAVLAARPEPLVVIRQANGGAAAARNAGLAVARGRYVAFLDSDDAWRPTFLERLTAVLEADASVDAVSCRVETVDAAGRVLGDRGRRPPAGDLTATLFANTVLSMINVVVRRDVVMAAGAFDETLKTNEDLDLWLRVSLRSRFAAIDETLAARCSRPGTLARSGAPEPQIRKARLLERIWNTPAFREKIPADVAHRRLAKVFRTAGRAALRTGHVPASRDLLRRSFRYRLSVATLALLAEAHLRRPPPARGGG